MIKLGSLRSYIAIAFLVIMLSGFIILPFSGLFSSIFNKLNLSVLDAVAQGKYPHPLLFNISCGMMLFGFFGVVIMAYFFNDERSRGN